MTFGQASASTQIHAAPTIGPPVRARNERTIYTPPLGFGVAASISHAGRPLSAELGQLNLGYHDARASPIGPGVRRSCQLAEREDAADLKTSLWSVDEHAET